MKKAAIYARVSTIDKGQDVNVQIEPCREYAERMGYEVMVFAEEGVSGAKESRPVLDQVMWHVRRRDINALVVWKIDRMGRSLSHLVQVLRELDDNEVAFHSLTEAINTNTAQGKLMFHIIGALSEFERTMIAERVREGLVYAERHGTRSGHAIGRPRRRISLSGITDALEECGGNKTKAAGRLGIPRTTLVGIMQREGLK